MPWYVFAIAAALFTSINSLYEKRVLRRVDSLNFSCAVAAMSALLTLPLLAVVPWTGVHGGTLLFIFFGTLLGSLAYLLATKSLRHLDISTFEPLLSLGPALTALSAFIILGEALSTYQLIGLLLAVIGSYVLQSHAHQHPLDPLREFLRSRYIGYIFLVLLIHAFTSLVDRASVSRFAIHPLTYIVIIHLFVTFHFFLFAIILKKGAQPFISGFRAMRWSVLPIAVLTILTRTSYAFAARAAVIGIVSALKGSASLITTLIGGELFHEKHLARKMVAAGIMAFGALLIVLA